MPKQTTSTPDLVLVNIAYNGGYPTVKDDPACIARGGQVKFYCDDATAIIVCQYNSTARKPKDHCPFADGSMYFTVAKRKTLYKKVKERDESLGEYKYAVILVPDQGPEVTISDPIIIIRQTL